MPLDVPRNEASDIRSGREEPPALRHLGTNPSVTARRNGVPSLVRRLGQLTVISSGRFGGAAIGFATQIFLARVLPAGELGLYFLSTSLAAFLAVVAGLGLPSVTVRFLIRYKDRARANLSGLFLRTARSTVLLTSCILAGIALVTINLWPGIAEETRIAASYGALAVPALAMCRFGGVSATALRRFNLSFLPDLFVRPAVFLGLLVGLYFLGAQFGLTAVLVVFALLAGGQAVFQNVAVARLIPTDPHPRRSGPIARRWLNAALPMVSIGILTAIFADMAIVFAGFFLDGADLALFGVCMKLTVLAGFVINTVYQLALPDLAEAFKGRDRAQRDRAVNLALLLGLSVSFAALSVGTLAGDPVLALFGEDYVAGKSLLIILLVGQVLAAAAGPGVQLLTLANGQSRGVSGSLATAALLLLLDFALIPPLGLTGAAIAVVLANALWAIWLAAAVAAGAGVRCDVGRFLSRRSASGADSPRFGSVVSSPRNFS